MSDVEALPGFPPTTLDLGGFELGDGVRCRPARRDDMGALFELYASLRIDEFSSLGWPEPILRDFLRQQFRAQHLHYLALHPGADFMVIESRGAFGGRLYLRRDPEDSGDDHLLIELSLLPSLRGRGIGSALVQACQRMAAEARCGLRLSVLHANQGAQRLYRRLGFSELGSDGVYLAMRWSPDASLS